MAWQPTEDQVDEIAEAFEFISGTENASECSGDKLSDLMRALGMNPSPEQLTQLSGQFGGGIKLAPFTALLKSKRGDFMDNIDEVTEAFRVFDKDGSGFISKKALKKTMTTVGEKLEAPMVDEFFAGVDAGRAEGDRMEYREFISQMSSV
jgi:calmodulin